MEDNVGAVKVVDAARREPCTRSSVFPNLRVAGLAAKIPEFCTRV